MPQDSLRSVVYRSFVTCDDPKGVAECKTIRKSKESKKMEKKIENQKVPKNMNSSSTSYKGERKELVSKGRTEESNHPASFQLMEVSRGAQKLNQVIDSWSKGMSFNGQSKDIAKDLLKGALDLQESLFMLSKLQEASHYMTKLKKKPKEKTDVGKADEVGIGRTNSDRFGNPNYQNPRLSADSSSRDCYDELRDMIRDSLARQNLLPNKSTDDKAYFDRKKRELYADMPSTSSSRSSMGYSHDFASSESSFSSKFIEEKPKVSNLITKLMGLEEITSKPLQSGLRKNLERDKMLNQRNPIFDIDMRKEKKPFVVQKVSRKSMTLEEIINNMQFKGLLKSNQHRTYHSKYSHLEKTFSNDGPPIVLVKPMHPGVEADNINSHPEEGAFDYEKPRIWKRNEAIPSKIMEYHGGALHSNEIRKSLHLEGTPVIKIPQEKRAKPSKKMEPKLEDKEVKNKEKPPSNKMKASVLVSSRPLEKDVTEKKVDKVQKTMTNRRKPVEMENVKSTSVPSSHEQAKVPSMKPRKSETGSNVMNKNHITQQKSTTSNSSTKRTKGVISSERNQRKSTKNVKPAKEPLANNVESMVCKDEDKHIDLVIESDMTVKDITPTEQLLNEESNASEILIKEHCHQRPNPFCENTFLPTQHESETKWPVEAAKCSNHDETESNFCETRTTGNGILSTTPSFLTRVDELLDNFNACQPTVLQALSGLHDCGIADSKLLLDCANELLERSSQRQIPMIHPLLQRPVDDSRIYIAVDHLMQEARNGIENLRGYSNFYGEKIPAYVVSAVLERDLCCKGTIAGAWDMGWREGFTTDEVQQIVIDLDKLVLSELIDEILLDFVH